MNIHRFAAEDRDSYLVSVLVPTLKPKDIRKEYFDPIDLNPSYCLAHSLPMRARGKTPTVSVRKDFIENYLMPEVNSYGVKYLFVGNSDYFKDLTGCSKSEAMLGYVLDCKYGPQKVIYLPNYTSVFYKPDEVRTKIKQGLDAFKDFVSGSYSDPGTGIIQKAYYPQTDIEISQWLDKLIEMNVPLAVDIEAFDLKHHKAGIGTISIAWSKNEGIAFPVDYVPTGDGIKAPFGERVHNQHRRNLLRAFFENLKSKVIYHNISFDAYVLIYQLFMKDILDQEGLLDGMDVMLRNWDCTKIISYLATNSCAGNDLSLKNQAQEFAGNWAVEEIKDITKIPLRELLQYNLVDSLSTHYVAEKNTPIMIADQQQQIYEEIFKPAVWDIIQMQLTGMPIHMPSVQKIEPILKADRNAALKIIKESPYTQEVTERLRKAWVVKKNNTLKVKRVTVADAVGVNFNPNSDPNMQILLHEVLHLPVLETTATGAPSTSGDVLKALVNHTKDPEVKKLLGALNEFSAVEKIITTYIGPMKNATPGKDGWHYLFGSFNIGGTVSGRLSSSKINLQNLPVKGKYGKLIKACFAAPRGWFFSGLDFDSLEDKISALTTKDPNKLKVYTEGFDGHCLRTYYYWPDLFPHIDPTDPKQINSIEDTHPNERGDSKGPTFALTYQGTWATLVRNLGWTEAKSKAVEASYHQMYVESTDWVKRKLAQASRDGYITAAFGLRVRTPLLAQVVFNTRSTPREAAAEGRTAGNALGQSWCLLNTRAASEFMRKVRASKYRLVIRPMGQIHDAQYYMVRQDLEVLAFVNEHLVEAVSWQDHPDIYHDVVKISGGYSVFYPTWNDEIKIPVGAKEYEIKAVITGKPA